MIRFAVACALALVAHSASAVDITFSNVCEGWKLRQAAVGLQVYCPSEPPASQVKLTLQGCLAARARLDWTTGIVVITCGPGSTFSQPLGLR